MSKRVSFTKNWSRDDLIAEIKAWARDHGKPPMYREWRATMADPSAFVVQRKFGGWGNALEAAGFAPYIKSHQRASKPSEPPAEPQPEHVSTLNGIWDQIFELLKRAVEIEAEEKAGRFIAERLEKIKEALA